MFDLLSEKRLTLSALARREGVAPSTIWRWTLRGVRGCTLETFSVGCKRYTTEEAVVRFAEACTAVAQGGSPPTVARTNRQREAAITAAERALAKAGI